jgi:hypothetical protein
MRRLSMLAFAAGLIAPLSLVAAPAGAAPTATVLATYAHGGQLSAQGGVLAIAAIADDNASSTLMVSTDGTAPVTAAGAGALPRWALPHLGTDAAGRVIVTYPRCSAQAVSSCDLYTWDLASRTERRLSTLSKTGVGETEGVFSHGAVAFNRWIGKATPGALVDGHQAYEQTTLFFKPSGGATRQISTHGGRQLALRGSWIAQVRDTETADDGGICGVSSTELVSITGKRVKTLHRLTCGENGQETAGPSFVGDSLYFAAAANLLGDGVVYRYRVGGATIVQRRTRHALCGFASTGARTGYALHRRYLADADDPVFDLERVGALKLISTTTA